MWTAKKGFSRPRLSVLAGHRGRLSNPAPVRRVSVTTRRPSRGSRYERVTGNPGSVVYPSVLMTRFPVTDWRAEQLRLTVFPMPGASIRSPEWWESMIGSPPDETASNPKRGSSLISGHHGTGKLLLKLEPDRIDWLFVPSETEPDSLPAALEFPTVGTVEEGLTTFSDIVERWLAKDGIPEVSRIAFGAVLMHPETDHRSGYLRLPDYVPVRVDPGSSDFLYQINRSVTSDIGIDGLRINRLSKWSVAKFMLFSFALTGTEIGQRPVPAPVYALRLELDINTAPEFEGPIPRARLVDVYRELVRLGREIVAEGIAQ